MESIPNGIIKIITMVINLPNDLLKIVNSEIYFDILFHQNTLLACKVLNIQAPSIFQSISSKIGK